LAVTKATLDVVPCWDQAPSFVRCGVLAVPDGGALIWSISRGQSGTGSGRAGTGVGTRTLRAPWLRQSTIPVVPAGLARSVNGRII